MTTLKYGFQKIIEDLSSIYFYDEILFSHYLPLGLYFEQIQITQKLKTHLNVFSGEPKCDGMITRIIL